MQNPLKDWRNLFPRLVIFGVAVFIISLALGFLLAGVLKKPAPLVENAPSPQAVMDLPISQTILENPNFTNWSADVGGKVIAKTATSFTISHVTKERDSQGNLIITEVNDGKFLEIRYMKGQTSFKQDPFAPIFSSEQKSLEKAFPLSDLPLDVYAVGNVKIQRYGQKWEAVGRVFTLRKL